MGDFDPDSDIGSHISFILDIPESDGLRARAHWLCWFHLMYSDVRMDYGKTESFINAHSANFPKFTKMMNPLFNMLNYDEIHSHFLVNVHLPVNRSSHLALWLRRESDSLRLHYADFQLLHGGSYSLPMIYLKKSIDLDGDKRTMDALKVGKYMIKDDVSISPENIEHVLDSYKAFDLLVKATVRR